MVIRVQSIGKVRVELQPTRRIVVVEAADITNFSAAARKAWRTMPARKVGRPRGRTKDKVSVTLRIDRGLWTRFQSLEALGRIDRRSKIVEAALETKIRNLERSK